MRDLKNFNERKVTHNILQITVKKKVLKHGIWLNFEVYQFWEPSEESNNELQRQKVVAER